MARYNSKRVLLIGLKGDGFPQGGTRGQILKKRSSVTGDYEWGDVETVVVKSDATQAGVSLAHNTEYRYTVPVAAFPIIIPAIAATSAVFAATVIYTALNATAPLVTNNSGYTLKYTGDEVYNNVFTPQANKRYRLSFVFDGVYMICYVSGF